MRRKLVKQGQNAITVTLPAEWVKTQGLSAGKDIDISIEGNKLIITKEGNNIEKSKTINILSTNVKYVRSYISHAYNAGFSKITLNFKSEPNFAALTETVNNFTGLEIVSSDKLSVVINSFVNVSENELEALILKMFQMIRVINECTQSKTINMKYIQSLRKTMLRTRDYCIKAINACNYGGDQQFEYFALVTTLNKIFSEYYYLSIYISKNKKSSSSMLLKILESAFEECYKCYMKKDFVKSVDRLEHFGRDKMLEENSLVKLSINHPPVIVMHYYAILLLHKNLMSRMCSIFS